MTIQGLKAAGSSLPIRRLVQIVFCAIVIGIGIDFYLFVSQLETGILPDLERPPGVEAFLPISALVSLKHFLFTGTINTVHPSALVLFLIICLTAMIVKKGFCSWVCPLGLVSDWLSKLHFITFKKKVALPAPADLLLRSLKYGLAGFFIWNIAFKMPIESIELFIQSPYNRFADIKMLMFFTQISGTALAVIVVLFLLSFVIPYFWCRYLCPYGAILGVIGFISLGRIKRNPSHCTGCGRCEDKCPGRIKIRQKEQIHSPECTACLTCVTNCPEKKSIGFSLVSGSVPLGQTTIAVLLVLMFTMGISLAKASGNWKNDISKRQYLQHVTRTNNPWLGKRQISPEKMERMLKMMQHMQGQRATPHAGSTGK